jgi:hypothetical protein
MKVDSSADVDILDPIATAGEGFRVVKTGGGSHMVIVGK